MVESNERTRFEDSRLKGRGSEKTKLLHWMKDTEFGYACKESSQFRKLSHEIEFLP